jgi:predicted Zn-dependent protease
MKRCRCLLLITAFGFNTLSAMPSDAQNRKNKRKDPQEIGNRDVGKGVNFYSLEREIALGKQLAQEVEREAKLVDHPIPAEFINRLAQNIARNSDVKFPVTAKVIDSDQVNAFALPGGFLFVNSGLIVKAETEAELASAMSHEIAHVAARHGTRQASRGQIVNIASIPLIFMGGWAGYAVRQGAGLMIPMTFLKFSRGFEEEADLLGLQYLYKAGYDPTAFVNFFERLEAMERKKPGTMSEIFRSHPNVSSRIKSTQKNIQQLLKEKPEYVVSTSEFAEVRRHLEQSLNTRKASTAKPGPTLRRGPAGSEKIEQRNDQKPDESDERPTLKRRDLI